MRTCPFPLHGIGAHDAASRLEEAVSTASHYSVRTYRHKTLGDASACRALCNLIDQARKNRAKRNECPFFFQIQEGSGLEALHYTSAGPVLISLLRAVLPHTHFVLMDHDSVGSKKSV